MIENLFRGELPTSFSYFSQEILHIKYPERITWVVKDLIVSHH